MTNEWREENNALAKDFSFADFKEALEFVNKVGEIAESLNHHPDISLHNYNRVTIKTTTHEAENSVTEKDRELIREIDSLF